MAYLRETNASINADGDDVGCLCLHVLVAITLRLRVATRKSNVHLIYLPHGYCECCSLLPYLLADCVGRLKKSRAMWFYA